MCPYLALRLQVATPGRLLDHLQNGHQLAPMFQDMRMLVLDEADRLLDMGFRWASVFLCALYPFKKVHGACCRIIHVILYLL